MSNGPGPTRVRGASRSSDRDIESRLEPSGRVLPDRAPRQVRHSESGGPGDRADRVLPRGGLRALHDPIQVDGPRGAEGGQRVGQELQGRVREVEDDPVHGGDVSEDLARVPFVDVDSIRPVRRHVRPEEVHGHGIHVGGVDPAGARAPRDQDGIGPDARERVCDDFPIPGGVHDSLALPSQARAEIGPREIDAVTEAVLHVDRRRPPLAREDLDLAHAMFRGDPPVLEDDPDLGVPPQDGRADRGSMGTKLLRELDQGDIADDVKGTRQVLTDLARDIDDVLVAPNGDEPLVELPLRRREAEVDAVRNRQEDSVPVLNDPQMPQEKAST